MNTPKLHHYVPQFYLRRFLNDRGRLWAWDKTNDVVFQVDPSRIAAQTNFYFVQDLAEAGHDPFTMEKQLSDLEGQTAAITGQWLGWLGDLEQGKPLPIPSVNRELVSLYIAVQYLRTADVRDILRVISDEEDADKWESAKLHTALMWDLKTVHLIRDWIKECIWVFGGNKTNTPFLTSDNPVAFRTPDNKQWRRAGILGPGTRRGTR